MGVMSWKLALAMSLDREVVVELRTRPKRTVKGKVTHRTRDAARRIEGSKEERSNVVVTIDGEDFDVERMSSVKLVGGAS